MAIYNPLSDQQGSGRVGQWISDIFSGLFQASQQEELLAAQQAQAEAQAKAEEQQQLRQFSLQQQQMAETQRQNALGEQRQMGDDFAKLSQLAQTDPEAARNLSQFYGFEAVPQEAPPEQAAPPPQGGSPIPDNLEFGDGAMTPPSFEQQAPQAPQVQQAPQDPRMQLVDAARNQEAAKQQQAQILLRARGGGPQVSINPNAAQSRAETTAQRFASIPGMEKYAPIYRAALEVTKNPDKAFELTMKQADQDETLGAKRAEAEAKARQRAEDQAWEQKKFYQGESNAEKRARIAASGTNNRVVLADQLAQGREQRAAERKQGEDTGPVISPVTGKPVAVITPELGGRKAAMETNKALANNQEIRQLMTDLEGSYVNDGLGVGATRNRGGMISRLQTLMKNQQELGALAGPDAQLLIDQIGGNMDNVTATGGDKVKLAKGLLERSEETYLRSRGIDPAAVKTTTKAVAPASTAAVDPERVKKLRARLQSDPAALQRLRGGR